MIRSRIKTRITGLPVLGPVHGLHLRVRVHYCTVVLESRTYIIDLQLVAFLSTTLYDITPYV